MNVIKTASQQQMKQINTESVFRLIQSRPDVSRAKLAKWTQLSPTTISSIVEELISKRLVAEKSPLESGGAGRKAITLEVDDSGKYMIGMEMDHQGVSGTVYNLYHEPAATVTERFEPGAELREEIPKVIIHVIQQLMAEAEKRMERLIGIGIGVAAVMDQQKHTLLLSTPFRTGGIPLYEQLREAFDYPVYLENETLLLATAERAFTQGSGSAASPFIYLAVNDGLGISVIMNNRYLQGAGGVFPEIGHMSLDINGELCTCGNRGCFERHVSVPALLNKVRSLQDRYPEAPLSVQEGGMSDVQAVAQALQEGDPLAQEAVREIGSDLGRGLVNLIHIFGPEMIVIGGKLSVLGDELLKAAMEQVESRALKPFLSRCSIVAASRRGPGATSAGAAMYVMNQVLEDVLL